MHPIVGVLFEFFPRQQVSCRRHHLSLLLSFDLSSRKASRRRPKNPFFFFSGCSPESPVAGVMGMLRAAVFGGGEPEGDRVSGTAGTGVPGEGVSHDATSVFPAPCRWHGSTGWVPEMNTW